MWGWWQQYIHFTVKLEVENSVHSTLRHRSYRGHFLLAPHFESFLQLTSSQPLVCILSNGMNHSQENTCLNRSTSCTTTHSLYCVTSEKNKTDQEHLKEHCTVSFLKPITNQPRCVNYTLWFAYHKHMKCGPVNTTKSLDTKAKFYFSTRLPSLYYFDEQSMQLNVESADLVSVGCGTP